MCIFSPHSLSCLAFFQGVTNHHICNAFLKERQAGRCGIGDTAVGHSTMVEAWENWHSFYTTPTNITRDEIRGLATLMRETFGKVRAC
jgi:hypothetical protein